MKSLKPLYLATLALVASAQQQSCTPGAQHAGNVLSSAVIADLRKIVDNAAMVGMAVGFVSVDTPPEFANFGVHSEHGDLMTSDVRASWILPVHCFLTHSPAM